MVALNTNQATIVLQQMSPESFEDVTAELQETLVHLRTLVSELQRLTGDQK